MNKKILLGIVSLLVLILIVHFTSSIKPVPVVEEQAYVQPPQQIGSETPTAEENVTNQPAYLVDAYSKNEKDYVDVDYVEWLHGEASLKAQTEDGECTSIGIDDCYDYPNGYKRNRNPKIRTFEVSPNVYIEVNGLIAWTINQTDQTNLENPFLNNLEISFKKLSDIVPKMEFYYYEDTAPPFKPGKAFITVDVKDNLVTKIVEPYQE